MIKLIAIMDKNNILAVQDSKENLKFLENIKPELDYFMKVVSNVDALVGSKTFLEAINDLDILDNIKNQQFYVMSHQSKSLFQVIHPKIKLTNNIHFIQDFNDILNKYQGSFNDDLYIWGGVSIFLQTFNIAYQIIIIRTKKIRGNGLQIPNLLHNFKLISTVKKNDYFSVESYEAKKPIVI